MGAMGPEGAGDQQVSGSGSGRGYNEGCPRIQPSETQSLQEEQKRLGEAWHMAAHPLGALSTSLGLPRLSAKGCRHHRVPP